MPNYNEFMLNLPPKDAKKINTPEGMFNFFMPQVKAYEDVLTYIKAQHNSGMIRLPDKVLHKLKRIEI